uniref:UPF0488 protein C8orf33 homolog isoform X1 n=1 Tax=Styela clava TaxID=7725 RepID=UPI00193AB98C|nr:UPF0488 protein C8orf33 homolog isoform X1 [Styela clava]
MLSFFRYFFIVIAKAKMSKKRQVKSRRPKLDETSVTVQVKEDKNIKNNEEISEDQKLQKELNWCIDQLRVGLMSQKSSQKQTQEVVRIIKTLSSSTAPLVKKRQIMRQYFGDYRKKIADEEARWYKDSQKIMKNSTITSHSADPGEKSIYIRSSRQNSKNTLSDVFKKFTIETQEEKTEGFRFNFDLPKD